jgi:hypothetical protein
VSRVRRHVPALLALVCLGVAAVLVLLALDAHTWQRTVARDDVRFRALPAHRGLWRPATLLPADPASAILGTGDAIAYRRTLQLFWYSRLGANPETRQDLPTLRAAAQRRLQDLMSGGRDAEQRSLAANLLGVLTVTTPVVRQDQGAITQVLKRSTAYFQHAIALDPANQEAKQNLELVLRLKRPGGGPLSKDARSGYGFGRGRGSTPVGSGY